MEKLDREELFIWVTRSARGHGKRFKKEVCRSDISKYSFPQRNMDIWNGLDGDIVHANSGGEFKKGLDEKRYGDGTV